VAGKPVSAPATPGTGSESRPTVSGAGDAVLRKEKRPRAGRRPTATRGLVARAVVGCPVPGGALIHPTAPVTFRSARADGTRRGVLVEGVSL
jgi:hypothetical protein